MMKRYKLWAPTWLKELGWAPEVGGVQDGWMDGQEIKEGEADLLCPLVA